MSQDGRIWRRIQGPMARQLLMGFELIQGAIELVADPNETFSLQAQFVSSQSQEKLPPAMKKAMQKAVVDANPITDDEIKTFSQFITENAFFRKLPKK